MQSDTIVLPINKRLHLLGELSCLSVLMQMTTSRYPHIKNATAVKLHCTWWDSIVGTTLLATALNSRMIIFDLESKKLHIDKKCLLYPFSLCKFHYNPLHVETETHAHHPTLSCNRSIFVKILTRIQKQQNLPS